MRVRRTGVGGDLNIFVGGETVAGQAFSSIPVTQIASGAGIDTSSFPPSKTLAAGNSFTGEVIFEGSQDGSNWNVITQLQAGEYKTFTNLAYSQIRARTTTTVTGTAKASVGATDAFAAVPGNIADWDPTLVRYFVLDEDNGDDANLGYIDAAPGTNISAAAPGVAIASWAQLLRIVPTIGNSRVAEVIVKARAGGVAYTNSDNIKFATFGYQNFVIRGTDTNATAGCTAWDNTAADRIFSGGRQVAGTASSGYNVAYSSVAITGATAASPVEITTGAAHGFATGDRVYIEGVRGIYEANGSWLITVTSPTTFTLTGSIGTGAYIAGGTQTVQRWKVTLASGGSPGFTDDASNKSLLGKRIRFDANTTTVALRNRADNIWSNGVDTIIPDNSFNAVAIPVGTDVFYIEEPGVSITSIGLTNRSLTSEFQNTAPPARNDASLALYGINVVERFSVVNCDAVRLAFAHAGAWSVLRVGTFCAETVGRFWSGNGTAYAAETIGGQRIGNAANPNLNSQLESTEIVELSGVAHISTATSFIMARVGLLRGTFGSIFSSGIEIVACGYGTGTTSSGTLHAAAILLGNRESILSRLTRVLGAGPNNAGILINQSNVMIRGVEISGVGGNPAVMFFGNGGFVVIRQLYGSNGNTDYGLDFAAGPPANFAATSRNWQILFVQTNACAVRGAAGAIRLNARANSAELQYADLHTGNIRQMEDAFGNKIQVVSTAPGSTGSGAAEIAPCTDYINGSGGALDAYQLVRADTAAERQAVLAQADSPANATGVLGATVNADGSAGALLITRNQECWVEFDRTSGHPAPSRGDQAYLSVDTAGLAQADAPATAATNQRLPIGVVTAIHPSNSDIGLVALNIAAAPVTA